MFALEIVRSTKLSVPVSSDRSEAELTESCRLLDDSALCSWTASPVCLANCSRPDWYSPDAPPETLAEPHPQEALASASACHFSVEERVDLSVVSFWTVLAKRSRADCSWESMIEDDSWIDCFEDCQVFNEIVVDSPGRRVKVFTVRP